MMPTIVPGTGAIAAPHEALPQLPLRYADAEMILVSVPVDLAELQRWLPAPVRARRSFGSFGFLNIQFVDMPRTTIGPYRECVVSVLCRDDFEWIGVPDEDEWRPAPAFPLWLSVTTQIARESGQAYWGYPKVLADTEFSLSGDTFCGRVHSQGLIDIQLTSPLPRDGAEMPVCIRSLTLVGGMLSQTEIRGKACVAEGDPNGSVNLFFSGRSAISRMLAAAQAAEAVSVLYVRDFDYSIPPPYAARLRS